MVINFIRRNFIKWWFWPECGILWIY